MSMIQPRLSPHRLSTEKLTIREINGLHVIINYCVVVKPSPWGAKLTFYEHKQGRISELFIKTKNVEYHYFECDPFFVTNPLSLTKVQTFLNGDELKLITTVTPL